jgi:hypothetical protein
MKFRLFGSLGITIALLAGCSSEQVSFENWVRSPAAIKRMQTLAASPEDLDSTNRATIVKVVGDGSAAPMKAIEAFCLAIPADKVLGSEFECGEAAKSVLEVLTKGKGFKKDSSYERALRRLWAMQMFRSLPLKRRLEILKRPAMRAYADPLIEGSLRPYEDNPALTPDQKFDEELSFFFVPSSPSMRKFQDAIRRRT